MFARHIKNAFFWLLNRFPHITIERDGAPYLTRWHLLGGDVYNTTHRFLPFNLLLHRFAQSDAPTVHDHPWKWARSLILSGAYIETTRPFLREGTYFAHEVCHHVYRAGQINRMDGRHPHFVTLELPPVWSLFLVGPKHGEGWGFYDDQLPHKWEPAAIVLGRLKPGERVIDGEYPGGPPIP